MPSVALSSFFNKTKSDIAGYTEVCDDKLITAVQYKMGFNKYSPGYRDGVVLVRISRASLVGVTIYSRVVLVDQDTKFVTVCKARVQGEQPRIKTMALVDSLPIANYLTAVVYRADVLAEDDDRSSKADWEIVALLAQVDEEEPMHHATLMANHFKADGGTDTKMPPEQFESALRKSYNYWKDRAIATTYDEYEG